MYPPPKTNMTIAGTSTMNEDVWILLTMGQPVMSAFSIEYSLNFHLGIIDATPDK